MTLQSETSATQIALYSKSNRNYFSARSPLSASVTREFRPSRTPRGTRERAGGSPDNSGEAETRHLNSESIYRGQRTANGSFPGRRGQIGKRDEQSSEAVSRPFSCAHACNIAAVADNQGRQRGAGGVRTDSPASASTQRHSRARSTNCYCRVCCAQKRAWRRLAETQTRAAI